jgi:DNA-binding transcriptional regulator YhcF (GntR family)
MLMAHDRVEGDEVPMTQNFLAMMLRVRRPDITVAIEHLQRDKLIRTSRGNITIAGRPGLEAAAYGSYATMRLRLENLLGIAAG